jgi:UDP-N-acetylmuramate--alanine ligase
VTAESSWSRIPQLLADKAKPGDVVITLGAGDVTLIGPEVLAALDKGHDRGMRDG